MNTDKKGAAKYRQILAVENAPFLPVMPGVREYRK
jgi:hypothetical protein